MEYMIEIIILLVLIWIFENKVIPQSIVFGLTIMRLAENITGDFRPQVIILYGVVMFYAGMSIYFGTTEKNNEL